MEPFVPKLGAVARQQTLGRRRKVGGRNPFEHKIDGPPQQRRQLHGLHIPPHVDFDESGSL